MNKTFSTIIFIIIPAFLAIYLIYRLIVSEELVKNDYLAMVFLHTILLVRTIHLQQTKKNKEE